MRLNDLPHEQQVAYRQGLMFSRMGRLSWLAIPAKVRIEEFKPEWTLKIKDNQPPPGVQQLIARHRAGVETPTPTVSAGKARPHAALIKEWAEGAIIQYWNDQESKWKDVVGNNPSWHVDTQYRVKPPANRYRVAQLKRLSGRFYTTTADSEEEAKQFEALQNFVKWRTDWIEYE